MRERANPVKKASAYGGEITNAEGLALRTSYTRREPDGQANAARRALVYPVSFRQEFGVVFPPMSEISTPGPFGRS